MRIIARSTLREYWEKHPDTEQPLKAWFDDAARANWQSPSDIKDVYANASIIANNRVVFNIKGNIAILNHTKSGFITPLSLISPRRRTLLV
jgi:mRNA interferase HigB